MNAAAGPDSAFVQIRQRALAWQDSQAPPGSPSGVIMETGYPEGVVMLVVMSDGTVSLFFSGGGSVLGAGAYPGPAKAARDLAMRAAHMAPQIPVAFEYELPQQGITKLYVLVDGLVRGVVAREVDFGENRSPFSPLFHAAHRVIAEVRRIPPPPPPNPAG
jgi:hypothetical protein